MQAAAWTAWKCGARNHTRVKKQVQKRRTSRERAKSVSLAHSVYLHRDERIKEEKQEPTKLLRRNTFKDCGSECLTQKKPAAAQ